MYRYLPPLAPRRLLGWLCRRVVLRRIHAVTACIPGDAVLAKRHFSHDAVEFEAFYPLPMPLEAGTSNQFEARENVILGNSGDPSNNHFMLLELAARHVRSGKIICPLAYGGERLYVDAVISEGRRLFSDRFMPLLELKSPKAYAAVVDTCRAALFAHDRQQGLGNIIYLLGHGVPTYMKEDVTSFALLKDLGLPVHGLSSLNESSTGPLSVNLGEYRRIVNQRFGNGAAQQRWNTLLHTMVKG